MKKVIIMGITLILIGILGSGIWYFSSLRKISKTSEDIVFTIKKGTSAKKIVAELYTAKLIRNELSAQIYMYLNTDHNFQAGTYNLNRNMNVQEIFKVLAQGGKNDNTIHLTFVEGQTLEDYLSIIAEATKQDYNTLIKEINKPEFLEPLIAKYWFLDKSVLEKDVYYVLEGYLFPNTYEFYQDSSLQTIVTKLLDETNKKLTPLKEEMENSQLSFHEILTMASIIEKESGNPLYQKMISQVIYTRIAKKMNLGMDVTSSYGAHLKGAPDSKALKDNNPYNTRLASLIGLPVGPICNPSLGSIEAALNPSDTDYIYFFASSDGVVHFTASYEEFLTFKETYK